jgi:hypothetical protein
MNLDLIVALELEITNEIVISTVMYRIFKSSLEISGTYSSGLSE